ncbi:hypothetical protein CLPU_9c00080 [Gottschalkia purinilytica]|uniref:4Fe-4S ferredoxin-type domain-containing protein n=1 Tax=Gottschalkia purinilytica TaxID=1503 RepID=A0A0L0W9I5_GOTPU|nr:hypothetical protein [Gottschalkia purinilytica]KNF08112.1 hypothetical protein CLPU_9c00080 [Gottschalkia purinilytica]
MEKLTIRIKEYALNQGADLFGVALASDLQIDIPTPHRPCDLMPSVKTVVVLGFHIPDAAIDAMIDGTTNYSYQMFGYTFLNREMDSVAYRLSKYIEKEGYLALPIPGRGCQYWDKKFHGPISFRHAAVAAGLGQFGWSGNVLTHEYGPRQRFIAILTDAPLIHNKPLEENPCKKCFECVKNCPIGAIKTKEHTVKLGNKEYTYGVLDAESCWWVGKGLTTKAWPNANFNPRVDVERPKEMTPLEKLDIVWKKRDSRIVTNERDEASYGATFCSRCMALCKAGKRNIREKNNNKKEISS